MISGIVRKKASNWYGIFHSLETIETKNISERLWNFERETFIITLMFLLELENSNLMLFQHTKSLHLCYVAQFECYICKMNAVINLKQSAKFLKNLRVVWEKLQWYFVCCIVVQMSIVILGGEVYVHSEWI